MRIGLLSPTYWPEVRRGSERVVHDLGAALAGRGHEVTLLTTHRGAPTSTSEDGITVVRRRRPPDPPGSGLYEYHLATAPGLALRLRRETFDVVHAFFPVDAWVATRMRRRGGPPVVATLHGIPTRQYLVARRFRLEMLREVVAAADECTVLSEAAADPFRRYLLREPRILAPGVVTSEFDPAPPSSAPDSRPTLFCAASLGDPRKRGDLLFAAFAELRDRRPDLRLVLAGGRDPVMSGASSATPPGVESLDPGSTTELAAAYAAATATVLPSVEEAFGLVLIESLAAGTPVVAARSGAAEEIVTDCAVGRLFEPGDERDLARAIESAIALGGEPGTAERCRTHASAWDWERIVPGYEELYDSLIGSGSVAR